tara:strand:+ start:225 stop:608 length:384 start_codon:yes stop_codon:yes gene_type:complete
MKNKNTELVLKVRSFKAGKYIKLMLCDSLEDFQKSVAPLIPRITTSIRRNDGHETKKYLEKYIDSLEIMLSQAKQVLHLIEENVITNLDRQSGESGKTITTEGETAYIIQPGDQINLVTGESTQNKE